MTTQAQVTRLDLSPYREVGDVLGRAFFDEPIMVFIQPDDAKRARALRWLYGNVARYGCLYGETLTAPGRVQGAAVWLPPGQEMTPLRRLIRTGLWLAPFKFGVETIGRFIASDHMSQLHKRLMREPHWYLWVMGVDPARQSQGIGTALVQPILARADAGGVPCYLDTHRERNIAFYQKHSFEVIAAGDIPKGGPPYWCMKRAPRT